MGQGKSHNNPFHLKASPVQWDGETPAKGPWESFRSVYSGARAGIKNLLNKQLIHGFRTPYEIVAAVSPPVENPTKAMAIAVAVECKVGPDTPIDLTEPRTLSCVAAALWKWEGSGIPVDKGMIAKIVAELLGIDT